MEKNLVIEVRERNGKFIVIKEGGKRAYFVCDYHSEAIDHAQKLCEKWGCKLSDLNLPFTPREVSYFNTPKSFVVPPRKPCCEMDYDKDGNCPRHPEQKVVAKSFVVEHYGNAPEDMPKIEAEELLVPTFDPNDRNFLDRPIQIPTERKPSFMSRLKEGWEDIRIWWGGNVPRGR